MDRLETMDRTVSSSADAKHGSQTSTTSDSHAAWGRAVHDLHPDASNNSSQETITHIVRNGETLMELSARYGVPV